MSDTILTQHTDGWMQITLNRPDRLNAFNDEMHAALSAALEEAEKPEVRALLLTGAGRGFCAGWARVLVRVHIWDCHHRLGGLSLSISSVCARARARVRVCTRASLVRFHVKYVLKF